MKVTTNIVFCGMVGLLCAQTVAAGGVVYENGVESMPVGLASKSTIKSQWASRYAKGGDEGRISVISGGSNVHSGNQALKIKYPKEHRGTSDSGGTWETSLGVHTEELYLAYWVKFGENFEWQHGGKLPGLGGTFSPFPADGEGDVRIRLMWRENGAVEFYLHDYALTNLQGEVPYRHWWNSGGQRYFRKGQWHHIEIHVKLNTPGIRDGVLEGFFDGELAFRDTNSNVGIRGAGEEDRKLNYLCWHSFFGGSSDPDRDGPLTPETYWGPPKDVYAYFDDFTVSTERIGMDGSHGGDDDANGGGDEGGTTVPTDLGKTIKAVDYDAESHPYSTTKIRNTGYNIGYIQNGTWVRYNDFNFDNGVSSIEVQATTPNYGGRIEVRVGSATGTKLGSVYVRNTGSWGSYKTFSANLNSTTGVNDLYLVFRGGSGGLFNLKSFKINAK